MKGRILGTFLIGVATGFFLCFVAIYVYFFFDGRTAENEISLDQALTRIKSGEITDVTVRDNTIELTDRNGVHYQAFAATDSGVEQITALAVQPGANANVTVEGGQPAFGWLVVLNLVPFGFTFGIFVFVVLIYLKIANLKVEK